MSNNHRLPNYERNYRYSLVREASAILRENSYSINGRPIHIENWQQDQFEKRIQLGAYCSRRKK